MTSRLHALSLAALCGAGLFAIAAPAAAARGDRPLTELRCDAMENHNGRLVTIQTPDLHVLSQAAEKYPTGTLARIALETASWRDVKSGGGTLDLFLRPRDLAPDLGADD